ncbi:hypothetical protein N4227_14285 [Yersinia enterocolitica]|uniref:hypothetical protein n=1 Tax=Enterobacterales TaxID=91347 RepID=UPI000EB0F193|nr:MULTISPECIES: hypothetical protein [Enterobacterales]AYH27075.1 hypothetical protein C5E20_07970 [Pectobacterium parmentieri]UYJ75551.1 hypothetical protein N4227_14285 [Yersinia enterocolitica]HEE0118346.1 hypothetical protein [Citrobacter gillenii]
MAAKKKWYWTLIMRFFFPEQRKWVARALIAAGIPVVTGPMWVPYANAALEHYAGFSVPDPNVSTGWKILALGLVVFVVNEVLDRRPKDKVASNEDVADRKSMEILFSNLYLPAFDQFFHYGKQSVIYVPVLHYFFGLEGFVQASSYHVHDAKLGSDVHGLHSSLCRALSYGEYFVEMSNADLQKFDSNRDTHVDPDAKRVYEDFISSVSVAEDHLRSLYTNVSAKYPDFDFTRTNQTALAEYREYYQKKAEKEAAVVSELEFKVLRTILDVEAGPNYPNLATLVAALSYSRVDIQVALDKLLERSFVAHLYRGTLHQKYTVLKDGRAYYASNRKQFGEAEST